MFRVVLIFWLALGGAAMAETVDVKYRGQVPLDSFKCWDTKRSELVQRVCYHTPSRYMVVRLNEAYHQHCEVGRDTLVGLLNANSMGRYYNDNLRSLYSGGRFDCRNHEAPEF